jgi:hypothetical protein
MDGRGDDSCLPVACDLEEPSNNWSAEVCLKQPGLKTSITIKFMRPVQVIIGKQLLQVAYTGPAKLECRLVSDTPRQQGYQLRAVAFREELAKCERRDF